MNAGVVELDLDQLRDILGLPDTIRVTAAHYDPTTWNPPKLQIRLEGDGLPLVPEGSRIPVVVMEFADGDVEVDEPSPRFTGFRE